MKKYKWFVALIYIVTVGVLLYFDCPYENGFGEALLEAAFLAIIILFVILFGLFLAMQPRGGQGKKIDYSDKD